MLIFRKAIQRGAACLNPLNGFTPQEGKIEIRWDPLTDLTSRIVHFPVRRIGRFNLDNAIRVSLDKKCPFCPENIEEMTPRFDKDLFGFERMERDNVTVVPNILSFDKYCLVGIICREHFADVNMLIKGNYLINGIKALIEALRIIRGFDREAGYFSINCNYMPMSGSSILHPHMQAIAGEYPTNYHGLIVEKSRIFFKDRKKVFWQALMDEEKRNGDRYIGDDGTTWWYAPFAPKGNIDLGCIFDKNSIFDLNERDLRSFGNGLNRVLKYLNDENVNGFNFSLFSGVAGEDHFRANARMVARRFLPPVNAADANYFNKIHLESACLLFPEDVAAAMRKVWSAE
jgi:UDPglucose--hexose-1-phosphate uridylyltransferase